jgi:hypothetical protein
MTAVAAPPFAIGPVDMMGNAVLANWYFALLTKTGHIASHSEHKLPAHWLGLKHNDVLIAAIGLTTCVDSTLYIDALVCEPSRQGVWARAALTKTVVNTWGGPIRFMCGVGNRSVRKLVQSLGSKPTAILYECPGKGELRVQ